MLSKPVNNAWQEIDTINKPVGSAWQECEEILKPVSGAWQKIWTRIKYMKQLATTFKYAEAGYIGSSGGTKGWGIFCNRNDGGYVTYYLEGDFLKPTISFDCDGWCNYESSTGQDRYASAGSVEIYTRTKSGTENYTTAFSSVNTATGSSELLSYRNTLSGDYDRIGYKIDLNAWSGADSGSYCDYNICIWNFFIGTKECLPSEDCVRD